VKLIRVFILLRYVSPKHIVSLAANIFWDLCPLCVIHSAMNVFRRVFPFFRIFQIRPPGFFSVASCTIANRSRDSFGFIRHHLIIRVVDSDPSNYYLWASSVVRSFKLWTLIPRFITFGPVVSSYHSSCGLRSFELFLFGQQHHWFIRVVDSGLTGHLFATYPCTARFAGPSVCYSRVFCHDLPNLCTQAISAITMTCYGHQSPDSL
jgi:hypothetical protein